MGDDTVSPNVSTTIPDALSLINFTGPDPAPTYLTTGGSDLMPIQQAEPFNFTDTDANEVDTSASNLVNADTPLLNPNTPVPVTIDVSDPFFGYSTTSSTVTDPAASPQPSDQSIAQSAAETNRLAGYANGTLYQGGSSVSPNTAQVVAGGDQTQNANSLANLYVPGPGGIGGTTTTGAGNQPSAIGGSTGGTAALNAQLQNLESQALTTGLQLITGPNNTVQAQQAQQAQQFKQVAIVAAVIFVMMGLAKP